MRPYGCFALAVAAAALAMGCELSGPDVTVETHVAATPEHPYRNMVVLFQFYMNGKPVYRTTTAVGFDPSRTDYTARLGPGDRLGLSAAMYWHNGTEYVAVTEAESRELPYAQARDGAEPSADGSGLRYAWNVNMNLVIPY